MYFLLNMGISHRYLSLLEGKYVIHDNSLPWGWVQPLLVPCSSPAAHHRLMLILIAKRQRIFGNGWFKRPLGYQWQKARHQVIQALCFLGWWVYVTIGRRCFFPTTLQTTPSQSWQVQRIWQWIIDPSLRIHRIGLRVPIRSLVFDRCNPPSYNTPEAWKSLFRAFRGLYYPVMWGL